MSDQILIDDEAFESSGEGWVEIPTTEFTRKLESSLSVDLAAFEVEYSSDPSPIGPIDTYTWLHCNQDGDQSAMFLAMKDPVKGTFRWFLHESLVE